MSSLPSSRKETEKTVGIIKESPFSPLLGKSLPKLLPVVFFLSQRIFSWNPNVSSVHTQGIGHNFHGLPASRECQEQYKPLYMAFVNLAKAFVSVNHQVLWKTLLKVDYPKQSINILRLFHDGMSAKSSLMEAR